MKKIKLKELERKVKNCKRCPLFKERIKNKYFVVFGEGNIDAKIMFVGEAPGLKEAKTGKPFCGPAGKILDELFKFVRIKRENVYITSLLKCRPPKNRDPKKEEIEACKIFLEKQIEIIKPKIICPLGRHSMKFLMEKFNLKEKIDSISKIHGKVFVAENLFQKTIIIPFYHPAVALYNPNIKKVLLRDFEILKNAKKLFTSS